MNMAQRWDLPPFSVEGRDPLVTVSVSKDIFHMVRLQKAIRTLPFECGGVAWWFLTHEVTPRAVRSVYNRFATLHIASMSERETARVSIPRVPRVEFDPNVQQYSDAFEKLYDHDSLTLILERVDQDLHEACSEYRKMMHMYDEALQANIEKDLELVPEIPREYAEYVERANAEMNSPFRVWENMDSVVDSFVKQLDHYTTKLKLEEITPNEFVGVVRGERNLFTRKFWTYFRGPKCEVDTQVKMIEEAMRTYDAPEFRGTVVAMKMILDELERFDIRVGGGSGENVIPIAVIDSVEERVSQNVASFKKHRLDIIDHMKEVARACDQTKLKRFFDNESVNVETALLITSTVGRPKRFACRHCITTSDLFPDMHRFIYTEGFTLRSNLVTCCAGDQKLARVEERDKKH